MSDDSGSDSGSEMDSFEEFPESMPSREDEDGSAEDSRKAMKKCRG